MKIDAGAMEPLQRPGDMAITVWGKGDTLVFSEHRGEVELTVRESEVMGWVARGKTTPRSPSCSGWLRASCADTSRTSMGSSASAREPRLWRVSSAWSMPRPRRSAP
jgi:hypothetical protein